MPKVPLIPEQPDNPEVRALFDEVLSNWPAVPNLYRALGNSPDMLRTWLDFAWPLRTKATTSRRLRELMILRGARVSRTGYEWAHHVPMALAAGVTRDEVDALLQDRMADSFSPAENAALRLAEEVTTGPAASDACMEALKLHYSDAEIVELVLTAGFYVCVGRVLTSLQVPLEEKFEAPW